MPANVGSLTGSGASSETAVLIGPILSVPLVCVSMDKAVSVWACPVGQCPEVHVPSVMLRHAYTVEFSVALPTIRQNERRAPIRRTVAEDPIPAHFGCRSGTS